MEITKIDAAKNQLATAIWLYFEDRDPISVHTLVHAASEIIDRLCDAKGLRSMRASMLDSIKPEYRKMVADKLNKPAIFSRSSKRRMVSGCSALMHRTPKYSESGSRLWSRRCC